jgi:hypothetical protein
VTEHAATARRHELVALGVAAEIVEVLDDQDAPPRPHAAGTERGGRRIACTDDDEIVALAGGAWRRHRAPERARVRDVIGPDVDRGRRTA